MKRILIRHCRFVTEFRVETYTPPYLTGDRRLQRPSNVILSTDSLTANGSTFILSFMDPSKGDTVSIVLYSGGWVTHSLHMGARMMSLDSGGFNPGQQNQSLYVVMPPSPNVAIPGPYMIFVLVDGTPSVGTWVRVKAPDSSSSLDSNTRSDTNNMQMPTSPKKSQSVSVEPPSWMIVFSIVSLTLGWSFDG